jgi:hypothetical protein
MNVTGPRSTDPGGSNLYKGLSQHSRSGNSLQDTSCIIMSNVTNTLASPSNWRLGEMSLLRASLCGGGDTFLFLGWERGKEGHFWSLSSLILAVAAVRRHDRTSSRRDWGASGAPTPTPTLRSLGWGGGLEEGGASSGSSASPPSQTLGSGGRSLSSKEKLVAVDLFWVKLSCGLSRADL